MKILAMTVISSLIFLSCSSDDMLVQGEQSKELYTGYKLKRDGAGAYSFDINTEDGVNIGKVKNTSNNTNELYLSFSNDNFTTKSDYGSDLFFNNGKFDIELISENSKKVPNISITDDNTIYTQRQNNTFLEQYTITKNDEGDYDLEFTVKNNVTVEYKKENDVYEIHLKKGQKSNETNNNSRIFEKLEGELLQLHFVSHIDESAKGNSLARIRKPVIVIDDGEDW